MHFARFAGLAGPLLADAMAHRVRREIQKFAQFDDFTDWDKLTLAPTTVKQDRSSQVQEDFLAKTGKTQADYEFKAVTS